MKTTTRSSTSWIKRLMGFFVLLLITSQLFATSIAIATSGGDRNFDVDDWRKKNIKEACKKFGEVGIKECKQAFTKDDLKKHIADAVKRMKCGDTLVFFFNGHGSKKKGFVFDKERHNSPDRYVSVDEIKSWIAKLDTCVKLYVAWHACYSGDYILKLLDDPHVAILVSSSGKGKKAHKKPGYNNVFGGYVNWRNWPDGFVDGLKKGKSLAEIFQKAAAEGKADAERKGGNKKRGFFDNPQDYKRGHIEKVEKTTKGLRVTLKIGNGFVTIIIPKNKATTLSGLSTSELAKCYDVEIGGEADFSKADTTFKPKKPVIRILGFSGKFHVIEVLDKAKKRVRVYFYNPPGLRGETKAITLDKLPDGIKFCKWYTVDAKVARDNVISGTNVKESTPEPYKLQAHVQKIDLEKNEVEVEIKKPSHLTGLKRKIKLKEGEKFPEWLKVCMMIELEGLVDDAAITQGKISGVVNENFKAHVKNVNRETGEIEIDQIERPARFKGETKKLKVDPRNIPEGLKTCKNVVFMGESYGNEVKNVTNLNIIN